MRNNKSLFVVRWVKKMIKMLLYKYNVRVYRSVDEKKILEVIDILKPYHLGHELIRVGGSGDGGYLIPNLLNQIDFCFSPGVGKISEFELELKSNGIKSFLADYSVEGPAADNLFNFKKKYIKSFNSDISITINDWIETSVENKESNFLMQMDIEGSEYEVINSISEKNLKRIKILIIEFHHLEFLTNEVFLETFKSVIKKLGNYFEVNHIHPNNCCGTSEINNVIFPNVMEVTFLNKEFVKVKEKVNKLPHKLDVKNVERKKDIILSDYWYS
jgi:hypothetical protein|tara:strand:+ start:8702 stop:9520 length:819 start_codon:yes stop_codon:yes gene_type:complete